MENIILHILEKPIQQNFKDDGSLFNCSTERVSKSGNRGSFRNYTVQLKVHPAVRKVEQKFPTSPRHRELLGKQS